MFSGLRARVEFYGIWFIHIEQPSLELHNESASILIAQVREHIDGYSLIDLPDSSPKRSISKVHRSLAIILMKLQLIRDKPDGFNMDYDYMSGPIETI